MKPNFNNCSDIKGLFTKEICPYYCRFLHTQKDSGGASIRFIGSTNRFPWSMKCMHTHKYLQQTIIFFSEFYYVKEPEKFEILYFNWMFIMQPISIFWHEETQKGRISTKSPSHSAPWFQKYQLDLILSRFWNFEKYKVASTLFFC